MPIAKEEELLVKERTVFERQREEFQRDHMGKVVLIKGEDVLGFFSSVEEAEAEAYSKLGFNTNFLARRIRPLAEEENEVYRFVNMGRNLPNG